MIGQTLCNLVLDVLDGKMLSARDAGVKTDIHGTYNNWGKSSQVVDHIFCSDFIPEEYRTIRQRYASVPYISDHYPVYAILEFTK